MYVPANVNAQITVLRELGKLAIKTGMIDEMIYAKQWQIKYVRPKEIGHLILPTALQLQKIRNHVYLNSEEGGLLFDILQKTGARIDSTRHLVWADVDFKNDIITFRKTKRKNYSVPMTQSLKSILQAAFSLANPRPSDRVTKVDSIKKTLQTACKNLSMDEDLTGADVHNVTHHTLRHVFATTCLEKGVNILTVSDWLGHSDGGKLALSTYKHFSNTHHKNEALKLD